MAEKKSLNSVKGWYIIDDEYHIFVESFEEASALLGHKHSIGRASLILMSEQNYINWHGRKTKRGKKS